MSHACPTCDAPYKLCDCEERIPGVSIAKVKRRDYVSPEFVAALRAQGARDALIRALAAEIPEPIVLNSFLEGKITQEETIEIFRARVEANAPWYVRAWRSLSDE